MIHTAISQIFCRSCKQHLGYSGSDGFQHSTLVQGVWLRKSVRRSELMPRSERALARQSRRVSGSVAGRRSRKLALLLRDDSATWRARRGACPAPAAAPAAPSPSAQARGRELHTAGHSREGCASYTVSRYGGAQHSCSDACASGHHGACVQVICETGEQGAFDARQSQDIKLMLWQDRTSAQLRKSAMARPLTTSSEPAATMRAPEMPAPR